MIVAAALSLCITLSISAQKFDVIKKGRIQLHLIKPLKLLNKINKPQKDYSTFDTTDFQDSSTKVWSILIPTLSCRKKSFDFIYNKLKKQIEDHGLSDKVEILYLMDDGEISIGFKRNALLQQSAALYISYVDDDDDVAEDYVPMIYEKLLRHPDCVSLMGIKTIDGQNPKLFIHSIKYKKWFHIDNIYYRTPNHLNPIRRAIAHHFLFPEISQAEDSNWSMQIAHSDLIKTEEVVDKPYYFYLCSTHKERPKKHKKKTQFKATTKSV